MDACAPALFPRWTRAQSPRYGFASTWSERHTAHVCGLGTFGLSDGLITPRGKAVRVGSVVVRARLTPTPRPYADHHEWCLFHAGGKCRACMKRCPAGAISEKGHDKVQMQELHPLHHRPSCGGEPARLPRQQLRVVPGQGAVREQEPHGQAAVSGRTGSRRGSRCAGFS